MSTPFKKRVPKPQPPSSPYEETRNKLRVLNEGKEDEEAKRISENKCDFTLDVEFCKLYRVLTKVSEKKDICDFDANESKMDLSKLTTYEYLSVTLVPILLDALEQITAWRPLDPIDSLVAFLLQHKEKYEGGKGQYWNRLISRVPAD